MVTGFLAILVILAILLLSLRLILARRTNIYGFKKADYLIFFIIGIIFFPLGLMAKDHGLWVFGLIVFMIALLNSDGWTEYFDNRNERDK